jgi:hypothetical protein
MAFAMTGNILQLAQRGLQAPPAAFPYYLISCSVLILKDS